jgi:hypothetical protein
MSDTKPRPATSKAVLATYGFFILLSLLWEAASLYNGLHFNIPAAILLAVFGAQWHFRNPTANLIIGLVTLFFTFFMFMEVLNRYNLLGKAADFGTGAKVGLALTAVCAAASGILVLSFTRREPTEGA